MCGNAVCVSQKNLQQMKQVLVEKHPTKILYELCFAHEMEVPLCHSETWRTHRISNCDKLSSCNLHLCYWFARLYCDFLFVENFMKTGL